MWTRRGKNAEDVSVLGCVCWTWMRGGEGGVGFAEEEVERLVRSLAFRGAVCNGVASTT